ncbi:MAG: hypothetical protein ACHRHE_08040 [Tepidisphaerales bacterium]
MSDPRDMGGLDDEDSEPAPIPAIPADKPIIPNYWAGDGLRLVTLRRMQLMEAEMARAKLESEGIHCFIAGAPVTLAYSLAFPEVSLQVEELNLLLAEKILSRPAAIDMEGEYADEAWRCPKCHRRTVDMLPLSPGLKRVRGTFFLLIVAQIIAQLFRLVIPAELADAFDSALSWGLLPWLLAEFLLGLWWLLSKREKRCRECGHQWSNAPAQSTD